METAEKEPVQNQKPAVEAAEFKSPLVDLIDDKVYTRYDKRKCTIFLGQYIGDDKLLGIRKRARKAQIEGMKENKPGLGVKDEALHAASWFVQDTWEARCLGPNKPNHGYRSWNTVSNHVRTMQKSKIRYEADPKEAAKTIKRVAKHFGACRVGITGVDKRHVYSHDCDGKEIVFEAVDEPYETEEKRVIPEKCKYWIVLLIQMSPEGMATAPYPIASSIPLFTYNRIDLLTGMLAEYIRGLGYTAIPCANDTALSLPIALEAGLGELSRMDRLVNQDFGAMARICKVLTDLPMELDRPVKFGVMEFCKVCHKCADTCPVDSISREKEPSFNDLGPMCAKGHKTWWSEGVKCWSYIESTGGDCGKCLNVCPWNKPDRFIHRLTKGIIKRTSLFNRFFVWLDNALGYGKPKDPEKWWDLDQPPFGIETRP